MWLCPNCGEQLDDQLESCWQCGSTRNATPPSEEFLREKEQNHRAIYLEFLNLFKCYKCNHTEARVKRVAMAGTGIFKPIDIQHITFIAVSCEQCGYTEFYNPKALERKKQF